MRTRLPRAEREAQMLLTARALFAARGYADVTMDEVAGAVGVTKPLLYNYYGNKEQLFLACMEPAAEALVDAVVSAVQGADDAPGALRAGIHAFFAFLDADGEAWRLLHDETLPADGAIAARVGSYRARMEALVTASIRSESRAVEPFECRHLRRRRGAGALVAAHRRAVRRAHRRAADPHHRAWIEDEMKTRRVAVVGGNRIPFARSNGAYAHASDQDMLTATLDGLVERFSLEGEVLGEVVAGAVLKHARDRDLTRESVLGSRLAPETPAYDLQQACGTGLETVITVANKIALGQIDVGIAGGVDTASDAPIAVNEDLRHILLDLNRAKSLPGRARTLTRLRPGQIVPETPQNAEPRTGLSMGEHAAKTALEWGITREEQDELAVASHLHMAAAYDRGFYDGLVTPYLGLERDQNLRPEASLESLAKLKPVFGDTMTAGNSTPLTDGASAVLLASEEWAAARGLPVLAWFVDAQTAAVDHVHEGEGLLMAPAYALPRLLDRVGVSLGDFDLYEIHEAFASQVLATLAAWRDPVFARERLGRDAPVGEIDRARLNVNGGSLAAGHPFAATGGRIVASLAKALDERGGGRGVISICAAGGQGVVAILEKS